MNKTTIEWMDYTAGLIKPTHAGGRCPSTSGKQGASSALAPPETEVLMPDDYMDAARKALAERIARLAEMAT